MFRSIMLLVISTTLAMPETAFSQQDDDVLLVDVDGRLTSGRPNFDGTWSLGGRSYLGRFDSELTTRDPGWNTLGNSSPALPSGASAPPANTDLEWDFLPMIVNGTVANLLYWDGSGAVTFGETSSEGYGLFLQSKSSGFIPADGSHKLISGAVIDDTDSVGSIHRHRFWFLDDGDDDLSTDPVEGVYLVALRTRLEGLDRSRPLFFVFGTVDTPATAIGQSQDWVDDAIDELTPDLSADFDGDLDVNEEDLLTWVQSYGTTGATALQINGDGNFNQSIDGADFLAWQRQFGSGMSNFAGDSLLVVSTQVAVPEPNSPILISCSCFAYCLLSAASRGAEGVRSKFSAGNFPAK